MLKKRLGVEAIERNWYVGGRLAINFKIPSILTIPKSVKWIGDFAFCNCEKLKEVEIPKSIKIIGNSAFWNCRELREVVIPVSVEYINACAFEDCREATIILKKPEKNFKYIGNSAFWNCRDVKEEIRG